VNTDFEGFVQSRAQVARIVDSLVTERHPDVFLSWKLQRRKESYSTAISIAANDGK